MREYGGCRKRLSFRCGFSVHEEKRKLSWEHQAHAIMWYEEGVLPKDVLTKILRGLGQLEENFLNGNFELDPKLEDVHINVEAFVNKQQGAEIGGWMHIGRSRNDQAACDTRLFLRDALLRRVCCQLYWRPGWHAHTGVLQYSQQSESRL